MAMNTAKQAMENTEYVRSLPEGKQAGCSGLPSVARTPHPRLIQVGA